MFAHCARMSLFDDLGPLPTVRPSLHIKTQHGGHNAFPRFSFIRPILFLQSVTMPGVGMPFGALLAAFLVLIPLPSHWKARNIATISMIAWLFVVNIILGVNTISWKNDAVVRMLTWCDIGEYCHAHPD